MDFYGSLEVQHMIGIDWKLPFDLRSLGIGFDWWGATSSSCDDGAVHQRPTSLVPLESWLLRVGLLMKADAATLFSHDPRSLICLQNEATWTNKTVGIDMDLSSPGRPMRSFWPIYVGLLDHSSPLRAFHTSHRIPQDQDRPLGLSVSSARRHTVIGHPSEPPSASSPCLHLTSHKQHTNPGTVLLV